MDTNRVTDIADQLELFNRKERNLLIRDLLDVCPRRTDLSQSFCRRIARALDLEDVPRKAWWATDYHLNWIAGAMALYGGKVVGTNLENARRGDSGRSLIEQSQEDTDLIIAFERTVILVEVKAYGYFTNKALDSKVARWRLLQYLNLEFPEDKKLEMYFLLMSRKQPSEKLNPLPDGFIPDQTSLKHAELKLRTKGEKLKVVGKAASGWRIVKAAPDTNDSETES